MDTEHSVARATDPGQRDPERLVLLFGGNGGLSGRYRQVAERKGLALRHFEQRLPRGAAAVSRIALIVVMVGIVSHGLREQAQRMAERDRVPIVYLRSASLSALQRALDVL